jgi:DNA-binding NarL/FixJ family response regulator
VGGRQRPASRRAGSPVATDEYVFEGLRAGAAGVLIKDSKPVEMLRATRLAAAGESLLSPSVTRMHGRSG